MNAPSSIPVFRVLGAAIVTAALLTACQHRTPYRASTGGGEPGYSSWQESGAVFHVVYVGAPGTKLPEARDLALLRAAELARAAGHREFVVLGESSHKRIEHVRHNTAPPQSAFVGTGNPGDGSAEAREIEARSRSMITNSVPTRIETQIVELKVSTQPDASHRAMDSSAPYVVDALLRDIPMKYGLTIPARS